MPGDDADPRQEATRTGPPMGARAKRFAITALIVFAILVLAWVFGTAVIPRWWAQRLSDLIDGRLTAGSLFGITIGGVFTLVPLLVLALAWRYRSGWRRAAVMVGAALVLAGPNLATLGIVLGNGNAAHAGERILDVDGPGFRGGSLVGALIGAVTAAALVALVSSRKRNKQRARALQDELAQR